MTFGHGKLQEDGYWEFGCRECAIEFKNKNPKIEVWPYDGRYTPVMTLKVWKDELSELLCYGGDLPETMEAPVMYKPLIGVMSLDWENIVKKLENVFGMINTTAIIKINDIGLTVINEETYMGRHRVDNGWIFHKDVGDFIMERLEFQIEKHQVIKFCSTVCTIEYTPGWTNVESR